MTFDSLEFPCACAANRQFCEYGTCAPDFLDRLFTLHDYDSDSLSEENEFTAPEIAISLAEFLRPFNQQDDINKDDSHKIASQSKAPHKSVMDE